jgi:hypothetical protein
MVILLGKSFTAARRKLFIVAEVSRGGARLTFGDRRSLVLR